MKAAKRIPDECLAAMFAEVKEVIAEARILHDITDEEHIFMMDTCRRLPHMPKDCIPRVLRALAYVLEHDTKLKKLSIQFVEALKAK